LALALAQKFAVQITVRGAGGSPAGKRAGEPPAPRKLIKLFLRKPLAANTRYRSWEKSVHALTADDKMKTTA
jgi:hypothetical protein